MKLKKNLSQLLSILVLILLPASSCRALSLMVPSDGQGGVPIDYYFQWEHVAGTEKYVLDIDQFTQSEDNILADNACSEGTCYFYFLNLSIGSMSYSTSYNWRVTAYNDEGVAIDASPSFNFSTDSPPAPPSDNGGGPIDLENPIGSGTLWDALDKLINFLSILAFVIAPILIIYAGFLLLTGSQNPEQRNKARRIILWALLALAIILFSKGLPATIKNILG